MAGNTLTLNFAGDADKLQRAAKQAEASVAGVAKASIDAGGAFKTTNTSAERLEKRLGALGAGTTGLIDSVETLGGGMQALADAQDYTRARAQRLARANVDVKQATEDMAQATRDASQANIDADQAALDLTQARLDQKTALDDYNTAVKEHGRNSSEARQAEIDLKQAGIDVKQAMEDQRQATRDASQANIDAVDAQLNLNDAMHEANPPQLQEWAEKLNLITPLLTAVVGVTSLVTAAQWAWNASVLASPVTWIVLAIVALIAGIVLLVKNWDTVKAAGAAAWRWIKDAAVNAWNWLKDLPGRIGGAFAGIGRTISAPFRAGFNAVAKAWNNTVGRLSWSVPGWVPGVGGNSISAPKLPTFHTGGVVPGVPGTEVLSLLQAGETVTPAGRTAPGGVTKVEIVVNGEREIAALLRRMIKQYRLMEA